LKKVIFCDVDGTLCNLKSKVTKKNINLIKQYTKLGGLFVLCTGREYAKCKCVIDQIGVENMSKHILTSMGGTMFDITSKEVIKERFIPSNIAFEIAKIFSDNGIRFTMCSEERQVYTKMDFFLWIVDKLENSKDSLLKTKSHTQYLLDNPTFMVSKIYVFGSKNSTKAYELLSNSYKDKVSLRKSVIDLEILNIETNKGEGVDYFLSYYGIDKNDCVAIGDSSPDIEMFNHTAGGFAVMNASNKLKDVARHIVYSNTKSGVAEAIQMVIDEIV
jgi:Cof subfamily protein (haloacid dehalogenase superfamily)